MAESKTTVAQGRSSKVTSVQEKEISKDITKENNEEKKILKETKYCNIYNQAILEDNDYTYAIERIFVKHTKEEEIRFSLYKYNCNNEFRYVPRSLDVTEVQLLELLKIAIKENIFSKDFLKQLKTIISEK